GRTGSVQSARPAEMALVPLAEFLPRVGMALPAEMLERIGRRDAAHPCADRVLGALGHALQEPSPERIADTGGIDDPVRRHGRHAARAVGPDDRAAALAARDDERPAFLEDRPLVEPGLLPDQLELVVVADDQGGAGEAVGELGPRHARALLPGVPEEGDL